MITGVNFGLREAEPKNSQQKILKKTAMIAALICLAFAQPAWAQKKALNASVTRSLDKIYQELRDTRSSASKKKQALSSLAGKAQTYQFSLPSDIQAQVLGFLEDPSSTDTAQVNSSARIAEYQGLTEAAPALTAIITEGSSNSYSSARSALASFGVRAVTPMLQALRGPAQPDKKKRLIKILGDLKATPAITEIMRLAGENKTYAATAEEALIQMGSASISPLIENLNSSNPELRKLAADVLKDRSMASDAALRSAVDAGTPGAATVLGHRLRTGSATDASEEASLQSLIAALARDKSNDEAKAALNAVAKRKKNGQATREAQIAEQVLILQDPQTKSFQKSQAISQLEKISGALGLARPLYPQILSDVSNDNQRVREQLVQAIGRKGDRADTAALAALLSDRNDQTRNLAEQSLNQIGVSSSEAKVQAPLLQKYLEDLKKGPYNAEAQAAAEKIADLAQLDPTQVSQTLIDTMTRTDAHEFDDKALATLEKMGPNYLAQALKKISDNRRRSVLAKLKAMGPKAIAAAPQLLAYAQSLPSGDYGGEIPQILDVIQAMGPGAKPIAGQLASLLDSPKKEIRQQAQQVLAQLDPNWKSNPEYAASAIAGSQRDPSDVCGQAKQLNGYMEQRSGADAVGRDRLASAYTQIFSSTGLSLYNNCDSEMAKAARHFAALGVADGDSVRILVDALDRISYTKAEQTKAELGNAVASLMETESSTLGYVDQLELAQKLETMASSAYNNDTAARSGILKALEAVVPEDYYMDTARMDQTVDAILREDGSNREGIQTLGRINQETTLETLLDKGLEDSSSDQSGARRAAEAMVAVSPQETFRLLMETPEPYLPPHTRKIENWRSMVRSAKSKSAKLSKEDQAALDAKYQKSGKFLAIHDQLSNRQGACARVDGKFGEQVRSGAASLPLTEVAHCGDNYFGNSFGQITELAANVRDLTDHEFTQDLGQRIYRRSMLNQAQTYWMQRYNYDDFNQECGINENQAKRQCILRTMAKDNFAKMIGDFCPPGSRSCDTQLQRSLREAAQRFVQERQEVAGQNELLGDEDPRKRWSIDELREKLRSLFGSNITPSERNRQMRIAEEQMAFARKNASPEMAANYAAIMGEDDNRFIRDYFNQPQPGLTGLLSREPARSDFDQAENTYYQLTSSGPGFLAHTEAFREVIPPLDRDQFERELRDLKDNKVTTWSALFLSGSRDRTEADTAHAAIDVSKISNSLIQKSFRESFETAFKNRDELAEAINDKTPREALKYFVGNNPIGTGAELINVSQEDIKRATDLVCELHAEFLEDAQPGWVSKALIFGGVALGAVAIVASFGSATPFVLGGLAAAGTALGVASVVVDSQQARQSLARYRHRYMDAVRASVSGDDNADRLLREASSAYDEYESALSSATWGAALTLSLDIILPGVGRAIKGTAFAAQSAARLKAIAQGVKSLGSLAKRMGKAAFDKMMKLFSNSKSLIFSGPAGQARKAKILEFFGYVKDPEQVRRMMRDLEALEATGDARAIREGFERIEQTIADCARQAA